MPRIVLLALLVWLIFPAAGARPEETLPIRLHGNSVIIDEVYLSVLELPPGAQADGGTADLVRDRLLQFLRRAGYELAAVEVKANGGVLEVEIEEGHLEKVIFLGAGSLTTVRMKLDLDLPHRVFNRPFLDRQLKALGDRYQISRIWYQLVPTTPVEHQGPQIQDLGAIQGQEVIPRSSGYELRIYLGSEEWDTGLGLDLSYDFPDGLELGASYSGGSLLADADRWLVGGLVGVKLRQKIESGDNYLTISHAGVEVRWYTPPLIGHGFRPFVWLQSDLVSRQRKDLNLEIAYGERIDGTLNLGYEIVRGLMVSLGGGAEEKFVFGVEQVGTVVSPIEEGHWFRPFLVGKAELLFDPGEDRRDRHHVLDLEARHHFVQHGGEFGRASWQYQKVFAFGWHDLWIKSRATALWGTVPFDEEEPVGGRYVRGCFGDKYYVHEVASFTAEFRLSLSRDLFKVSVFHDLAVFGQQDRINNSEIARVADSVGLGFHALILDLLQLDLYYAFGFASDGSSDHGAAAVLTKVF